MRTRTKQLVAIMPPMRFREEKAAEKVDHLLGQAETKIEIFRKPKGRPLKERTYAPLPSQLDKKRTRAVA